MLLDLAHMYEKFIRPLPNTVDDFADELLALFPGGLIDTKYLVNAQPTLRSMLGMDTSLSQLFTSTAGIEWNEGLIFLDYVETFGASAKDSLAHQAAFDAIVTGYVFLRMSHFVARKNAIETKKPYTSVTSFDHLTPEYLNVINVFRCDADLYLDRLRRSQVRQLRGDIFFVSGLTTNVTTRDLHTLFRGYGKHVNISWINDRCAYVQVSGASSMQMDALHRDIRPESSSEIKAGQIKIGCNIVPFHIADESGIIDTVIVSGGLPVVPTRPKRLRPQTSPKSSPQRKKISTIERQSYCMIL
jgi:hypothetical protein